jgi:hypothetical protein
VFSAAGCSPTASWRPDRSPADSVASASRGTAGSPPPLCIPLGLTTPLDSPTASWRPDRSPADSVASASRGTAGSPPPLCGPLGLTTPLDSPNASWLCCRDSTDSVALVSGEAGRLPAPLCGPLGLTTPVAAPAGSCRPAGGSTNSAVSVSRETDGSADRLVDKDLCCFGSGHPSPRVSALSPFGQPRPAMVRTPQDLRRRFGLPAATVSPATISTATTGSHRGEKASSRTLLDRAPALANAAPDASSSAWALLPFIATSFPPGRHSGSAHRARRSNGATARAVTASNPAPA